MEASGEINVLRQFAKKIGNYDLDLLKGYTLYTTCEPCAMCAAACVWIGVSEIVYGASVEQLLNIGSEQIDISCQTIVDKGFQKINVVSGILAEECCALFK
ncbi:MAG: nucleoside deaminase [Microcoleaceae cyanobacterium]